jgi:transcriptional regulator with XRE-family HTH domain
VTGYRSPVPEGADAEICAVLTDAVARLGLSRREAAAKAGVSYQVLNTWLNGARKPTAAQVLTFVRRLGFESACVSLLGGPTGPVARLAGELQALIEAEAVSARLSGGAR